MVASAVNSLLLGRWFDINQYSSLLLLSVILSFIYYDQRVWFFVYFVNDDNNCIIILFPSSFSLSVLQPSRDKKINAKMFSRCHWRMIETLFRKHFIVNLHFDCKRFRVSSQFFIIIFTFSLNVRVECKKRSQNLVCTKVIYDLKFIIWRKHRM